MESTRIHTPAKIHVRFRQFRRGLRDVWATYILLDHYLPQVHQEVRMGRLPTLTVPSLLSADARELNRKAVYGGIDHVLMKVNPQRVITDSVASFEDYLGDLLTLVYRDYPKKLMTISTSDADEQAMKLLTVILDSTDKAEILDRIIEERVRGIFYKRPVDFFLKDRGKLEFGDYFGANAKEAVRAYTELTARRNLLAHNAGRVDRKYLREVKESPLKLGAMVVLDRAYLRNGLALLEGLGAAAGSLALQNIYKVPSRGYIMRAWRAFERGL